MQDLLLTRMEHLGLDPTAQPGSQYLQYIALLHKWNQAYNLTAVKKPEDMLRRHVLDSLSVLAFIKGRQCLDIGTGAGLPGLILALAQTRRQWTLLDSNQKKIRFLTHIKGVLNVDNVEIVQARVEDYQPKQEFDTLICRAVAPLQRLLEQTAHLITPTNQLLAMKGRQVGDEINALGQHEFLIAVYTVQASAEGALTNMVQIRRAQ